MAVKGKSPTLTTMQPPTTATFTMLRPTTADTQQLELTGYAIQHLLQHYTPERLAAAQGVAPSPAAIAAAAAGSAGKGKGAAGQSRGDSAGGGGPPTASASASAAGGLYSLLPEDIQPIVAPYLTTKFTLGAPKPSTDTLRSGWQGACLCGREWMVLAWLCRAKRDTKDAPTISRSIHPTPPVQTPNCA